MGDWWPVVVLLLGGGLGFGVFQAFCMWLEHREKLAKAHAAHDFQKDIDELRSKVNGLVIKVGMRP